MNSYLLYAHGHYMCVCICVYIEKTEIRQRQRNKDRDRNKRRDKENDVQISASAIRNGTFLYFSNFNVLPSSYSLDHQKTKLSLLQSSTISKKLKINIGFRQCQKIELGTKLLLHNSQHLFNALKLSDMVSIICLSDTAASGSFRNISLSASPLWHTFGTL